VLHIAAEPTTLQRPQVQPVWQAGLQAAPALGSSAHSGVGVATGHFTTAWHRWVLASHSNPSGHALPASAQMKPSFRMLGL
jgi:hypothetical protein